LAKGKGKLTWVNHNMTWRAEEVRLNKRGVKEENIPDKGGQEVKRSSYLPDVLYVFLAYHFKPSFTCQERKQGHVTKTCKRCASVIKYLHVLFFIHAVNSVQTTCHSLSPADATMLYLAALLPICPHCTVGIITTMVMEVRPPSLLTKQTAARVPCIIKTRVLLIFPTLIIQYRSLSSPESCL